MAKTKDPGKIAETALGTACLVVEAIRSLDIPREFKKKFLDRAVWLVTVPRESMKYKHRYRSPAAHEICQKIESLRILRCQAPSLAGSLKGSSPRVRAALSAHFPGCTGLLTDLGATDPRRLRHQISKQINGLKSQLCHEHVTPKAQIVERLLTEKQVRPVLKGVEVCIVTKDEHRRLHDRRKVPKGVPGWKRYRKADIKVIDTAKGKPHDFT